MKSKSDAATWPRTLDHIPEIYRSLFPILLLPLLLLCLLFSMGSLQKNREALAERIAPSILRFHILANSDSRKDQNVKLEVRSFLLDYIQAQLPESADSKEAVTSWLSAHKSSLESVSSQFLAQKQMPYSASLSLERAWFPTRVYDNLVIPCGTYDAVRVILGKGKGHNWWCVLYPRFCFLDETCKEIPEESRKELQDQLNQGDYPLLEDHRPDLNIRFFFFPEFRPVLPSHSTG